MSSIAFAYLGKAGAMRQLVQPPPGFESGPSMSEAVFTLLSGGTAKVGTLYPKRRFTLPYDLTAAQADVILAFYQGVYAPGPYRFVDPTARNMLRLDAAACGARLAADDGWVSSAGALAASAVGNGPAGVDSGVITWTAVASATLQPGGTANTADTATAPVYIPAEPVTVSVYVKASSSSSGHTLQLVGYDTNGAVSVTSATTSMSLTTSFQRFTVTIAANAAAYASAFYVLPRIVLAGTVPTSVSISGAQVEYADTVSTWQPGFGCPRVVITDPPGRSIPAPGYRTHTLTLAEV